MLREVVVGVNHHLMRGGEFSTGDLRNFQPALTKTGGKSISYLSDGRIQMPDVYRIAFRFGRRGGVKPLR